MLDLEARVHLDEVEAAASADDELDRAGADIADGPGGGDRGLAQSPCARSLVEAGRGRLLDHLLVAALDRAVALEEVDRVAVAVGEDLHLDMPRPRQIFLDQHPVVAEGRQRLAPGARQAPRRNPPASPTIRMPRPPPPADALISTG